MERLARRITFVDLYNTSSQVAERVFRLGLQNRMYMVAGISDKVPNFDYYLGSAGVNVGERVIHRHVPFSIELRDASDLFMVTNGLAMGSLCNDWLISESRIRSVFVSERNLCIEDEWRAMERELADKLERYLPPKK